MTKSILCLISQVRGDPKTFEASQADCLDDGGYLAEIKDQNYTNPFLAELLNLWLLKNPSGINAYWSGGIRNYAAGKKFDIWHSSGDVVKFSGFPDDYRPVNHDASKSLSLIHI